MQETENTGVIYMISNTINNKKYIGKAYSYVKNGNQKIRKHGAEDRFYKHVKAVNNNSTEIPLLYNDMRTLGTNNFNVVTLEVCLKENLKEREEHYIRFHQTFKKDLGYNYHVADNKPEDHEYKKVYENKKVLSNKSRAVGGRLRQAEGTVGLPPNVYKRPTGLFAQIKINGTLYNKSFLSSEDSNEQKLEKALAWLENIKAQHGDIVV